ncbi:hypothetical protein NKJ70_23240 [Mesorhizobium sp. M0092]|uniref:hypothetical protein n=1 Tax=Mesorhizobium sp. M0092 TaxID=2956876 RepID=UPI00333542F5
MVAKKGLGHGSLSHAGKSTYLLLSAASDALAADVGSIAFKCAVGKESVPGNNDIVIPQDHDASPLREEEYFVLCPACGQAFDIRCMAEALHHNELGHEPYDLDS